MHYKTRDVFAPIGLNVYKDNDNLDIYIMSDKLTDANNLTLQVSLINFKGEVIKSTQTKVTAKANVSEKVLSLSVKDYVTEEQQGNSVVKVELVDNKNNTIAHSNYFFNWPNKLNLPQTKIEQSTTYADGKYTITLKSKYLAKDVFVDIPIQGAQFNDNFFDLLPSEKKVITITSPELLKSAKTPFTIKHLRETYK